MPKSDSRRMRAIEAISEYVINASACDDFQQMHLNGSGAVAKLEERLKKFYGMRHALCVSNATAGLMAVALALDLRGDEFVTTPVSFGGSIASWLLLGNKVIFADVEPSTLTLDCKSVRRCITPRTRAILSVDIFGNPSHTDALRKLCDEYQIWYIADAAQSLGAYRNGKPASCMADALVVSFSPSKSLFAGEGGAVMTNNSELYQKMIWHTQHPARQRRDLGFNLSNEFAINGRISPLSAVWANSIFDESLRQLQQHQAMCFGIIRALNSIGLTMPIDFEEKGITPSFFRLTAKWKRKACAAALLRELHQQDLSVNRHPQPFTLLYQQPAFVAQYGRQYKIQKPCSEAEKQIFNRFSLVNDYFSIRSS